MRALEVLLPKRAFYHPHKYIEKSGDTMSNMPKKKKTTTSNTTDYSFTSINSLSPFPVDVPLK